MAYSTITDVEIAAGGERALRELSDVNSDNAVNAAVVESAIAESDAVINTYVHKRYGVDLVAPVPPAIRTLSASMAVFTLKSRRRNLLNEVDVQLQQQRIDMLGKFAKGETSLGVTPIAGKSEYVADSATARPTDKDVSRENLKGFW